MESKRLHRNSGYRSPPAILRKLADANLVFDTARNPSTDVRPLDSADLAVRVMQRIGNRFNGDRALAQKWAERRTTRVLQVDRGNWSVEERNSFKSMAMLVANLEEVENWSASEKRALAAIIRAKGGREEHKFIRKCQKHHEFYDALVRLTEEPLELPAQIPALAR